MSQPAVRKRVSLRWPRRGRSPCRPRPLPVRSLWCRSPLIANACRDICGRSSCLPPSTHYSPSQAPSDIFPVCRRLTLTDYLPHITRRQAQASSAVPDTDDSRELVARSLLELAKDPKSAGLTIDLMNGSNDLAAEIKKVVEAQTDAWTG